MKNTLIILSYILVLFGFLLKVGNGLFDAFLVVAVVSIIAWVSYTISKNKKSVFVTFLIILFETIIYYLYEITYVKEVNFLEQLYGVSLWCGCNFLLAILTRFIPRTKELSPFFWMNGIVSSILFLYCASQICRAL